MKSEIQSKKQNEPKRKTEKAKKSALKRIKTTPKFKLKKSLTTRLMRNALAINRLSLAKNELTKARLVKGAQKDLILSLVDYAKNLILGNVDLSLSQFKALMSYQDDIRTLARSNSSIKKRKLILEQRGGFLGALLSPLIGLLGNVLGVGSRR